MHSHKPDLLSTRLVLLLCNVPNDPLQLDTWFYTVCLYGYRLSYYKYNVLYNYRYQRLYCEFKEKYERPPTFFARAPGRVNLIGGYIYMTA